MVNCDPYPSPRISIVYAAKKSIDVDVIFQMSLTRNKRRLTFRKPSRNSTFTKCIGKVLPSLRVAPPPRNETLCTIRQNIMFVTPVHSQ